MQDQEYEQYNAPEPDALDSAPSAEQPVEHRVEPQEKSSSTLVLVIVVVVVVIALLVWLL